MKKFLAIALALVMTLALVACGNQSADTDTGDDGGKATIRFMVNGSAEELALYEKAVNAFNEQSETTFVEMIGVTGDDYTAQVITQLSSNEAPDVFYSEEGTFGELNQSGTLAKLNDYLNAEGSALTLKDIPESILAGYTFDGNITGVPVDSNPEVIYYNVDLFKELNIKSPAEYVAEGTWNFANFQATMQALKDAGKYGFVWENWWGPVYSFMLDKGDSLYTEDGNANFKTDRVMAGVKFLEENVKNGNIIYAGSLESGESADTLFMAGDTGMVYNGRWSVPDYQDCSFTFDTVLFPGYESNATSVSAVPATPMVVNAACANLDSAWEFVSFYCGAEGQRIRMEGQGNAVPTVPGLEDIVLTGTPENAQAFLDALDCGFLYPQVETLHPGLTDIITGQIESMLVGDQDAAACVENIQTQAQAFIDEAK